VLYEMLTGARPFQGEDVTTIASVVKRDGPAISGSRAGPNWTALPASVPTYIRTLVRQCLQKDRKQRIGDIAVIRYVLNDAEPIVPENVAAPAPVRSLRVAWAIAATAMPLETN
jgi:serine/threonine protein kinase